MSGIEILGLLAGVTQLIDYSIKISAYFSDAGQKYQKHNDEIKGLTVLAQDIEKHPLLQTGTVHSHVKAILIDAENLCTILDQAAAAYSKGPVRRLLYAFKSRKENDILATAERLERKKSTLGIDISVIQLEAIVAQGVTLASIKGNFEGLAKDSATKESESHLFCLQKPTIPSRIPSTRGPSNPDKALSRTHNNSSVSRGRDSVELLMDSKKSSEGYSPNGSSQPDGAEAPHQQLEEGVMRPRHNSSKAHHVFINSQSSKKARQHNGDFLGDTSTPRSSPHHYKESCATDESIQVNGNTSSSEATKFFFGKHV